MPGKKFSGIRRKAVDSLREEYQRQGQSLQVSDQHTAGLRAMQRKSAGERARALKAKKRK